MRKIASLIKRAKGGTYVDQSVKCMTLDVGSGLDLRVMSSSSMLGSKLGMECTLKRKKRAEGLNGIVGLRLSTLIQHSWHGNQS